MSSLYKDYDNVIYEICNEPNGGTTWADVKSYAEEVIPIIRKNTKDALIIVGTPTWSQDVDIAAEDPVTGYDNNGNPVIDEQSGYTNTGFTENFKQPGVSFAPGMHLEMVRLITIRQQNGLI